MGLGVADVDGGEKYGMESPQEDGGGDLLSLGRP